MSKNHGIKLNKKSNAFLKNLEQDFGCEIYIEIKDDLKDHEYGFAKIDNGKPIIQLNKNTGLTPENLIHEAFHLRQRLDGFSIPCFKFNDMVPRSDNNEFWMKEINPNNISEIFCKCFNRIMPARLVSEGTKGDIPEKIAIFSLKEGK